MEEEWGGAKERLYIGINSAVVAAQRAVTERKRDVGECLDRDAYSDFDFLSFLQ